MDAIESLATGEPLNARTLTLTTNANEEEGGRREKWEALRRMGVEEPKVCLKNVLGDMDYC